MQAKRLQNSCCTVCDQKWDCGQEQSGKFKDNWAFLVYLNVFIYLTSHLLLVLRTVSNRRPLANENRHPQRLDRDNEGRQSETQGCTLRVVSRDLVSTRVFHDDPYIRLINGSATAAATNERHHPWTTASIRE